MAYQYTPLNKNNTEIRLLRLLPGKRKDAIHILIDHVSFSDDHKPEYEALSYTWGDSSERANIAVGRSGEHSLTITKNLAEALPYLRREDMPRIFWIDAICVNQADLDERSRQVSLMASLYLHAHAVVVWLGPEAQDSDVAFRCIELLYKKVKFHWDLRTISCLTDDDERWIDKELPTPFSEKELVALEHVFGRPWFERLWVWQEVRLGGERAMVQCGDRCLEWHAFPNALGWYRQPHISGRWLSYKCLHGTERICDSRSHRFCELLAQARTLECQDRRDRVFAVLSLQDPPSLLYVHVDYTKPVPEVYKDAVIAWLSHHYSLRMLEYIITPQITPNLPSWVPDWAMIHIRGARQQFGMASSSSSSRAPWEIHEDRLKLTGKFIGTIKAIQRMPTEMPEEVSWADCNDFVENLSAQDGLFRRFVGTRGGLEALCRTLCAGGFAEHNTPVRHDFPSLREAVEALAEALRIPHRMKDQDYILNMAYRRFWQGVGHIYWGRGLVLLENGMLGMAPVSVMPGDRVSLLLGCGSAMVLRDAGDGAFQAIGNAYIDGFMHGEALLGSLPAHITPVMRLISTACGGGAYCAFRNEENGDILSEDPRLGPLPPGWKRLNKAFDSFWPGFENEDTGEIRAHDQDPRCDLVNLVARGVELQAVELV
jgi:hypothetical protein